MSNQIVILSCVATHQQLLCLLFMFHRVGVVFWRNLVSSRKTIFIYSYILESLVREKEKVPFEGF